MGKILYIRLDSSPLPEACDEIIVKDFNLESYFCALLGRRLLEDAGQGGVIPYPGRLVTDFEKADKEAYREIIRQWEGILASSLISQQEEDKNYEIELPVSYVQWLSRNEFYEYFKFSKVSQKAVLSTQVIYEIIHSVLLKKILYFLRGHAGNVKYITFSIDNIGEQSYAKHLIEAYDIEVVTLRRSCIFLPYDWVGTSNTSAVLKRGTVSQCFVYGRKGMLECDYDDYSTFVNGYVCVRKGDKWGAINEEGIEVIPCMYDRIVFFHTETSSRYLLARASLNNRYGVINIKNETLIPFEYEDIKSFDEKYAWAKFRGKWGTIDIHNEVRIPFKYECWGSAYGDYYAIEANSKKGLIRNDGSEYLPCIFISINYNSQLSHTIVYNKVGEYYMKDVATFYIRYGYLRYYSVWPFRNGMAIVRYPNRYGGKYGFINESGDEVVRAQYEGLYDFNDAGLAGVCKNGKYGMIDKSGKPIVPFIYEYISGYDADLMFAKKEGKYGYLNNKGVEVIPFIYDDAGSFDKEGVARVVFNGEKMCIDKKGEILFRNLSYDSIDDFYCGVAVVHKNGEIGLIDRYGKEIWPCSYSCDGYVNRIYLNDFLIVSKEKKYGILNLDGKELIPCILDDISPFSGEGENFQRYGVIKRNDKYALIEITKDRKDIVIL